MSKRIILVDDDALLRRSLAFNLDKNGYSVQTADTAENGIELVRLEHPDLVLLDIGLPGMDGLEALRSIRDHFGVPVILLTARRRELDEVLGLELGADDYVTKPFDLDVLLAHIKAVLRRFQTPPSTASEPAMIEVGDLAIDPVAHEATLHGNKLDLAPREFNLLYSLADQAGRLVTTDELLAQVWGAEYEGQSQVVYVHIRWLREKLEEDPNHPRRIVTVRGLGYKYLPQET
ncbi:MAG TPA: response regulator transcription factor [Anaerolineaceae bacterium]|nr:response regulator transcription factor [Anaerolineaceae bacterium]